MSQSEKLRAVIAPMLSLRPEDITAATPLTGLNSSLAGARLGIAVKRLGLELPKGPTPANFGALERLLTGSGEVAAAPTRTATQNSGPASVIAGLPAGIDVQQVTELPETTDFWTHEWYSAIFSPVEIAWAVAGASPREHFAGFWCAKEALRKCDSQYRDMSPVATFVAHEEDGRPFLCLAGTGGAARLPHTVSISHSGSVATALVIRVPEPAPPPKPEAVSTPPPRRSTLPAQVGLAMLVVAALAIVLLRSYL